MRKLFIGIITMMMFSSCVKELDFDYGTVEPIYVVEAYVTNYGTHARVTQTQDVLDTDSAATVNDAQVMVNGSDGSSFVLRNSGNGNYTSDVKGIPGVTYTLTAKMGDVVATSQSTMKDSVLLDSCLFVKENMMGNDMYMLKTCVKDDGKMLRQYLIRLYRNGDTYKWSAKRSKQALKGALQMQMTCFTDNESATDESKQKNWLYDGDVITGYVCRIDTASYDYFTSWAQAGRNNSNPIYNFSVTSTSSSQVLGIFSAQYITPLPTLIFRKEDVKQNN